MPLAPTAPARPQIILSASEAEQLSALATRMEQSSPLAAELLLDEIERAELRPDGAVPSTVVRMGSVVEFFDEAHGSHRTVQLVWPADADIGAGRISVLTPVGAGLIGMAEGGDIVWPDRAGHERALHILKVSPPA